jgi:hypothetical protein
VVRLTSDRAARRQHLPFPPLLLQILAAEGPAGLYRGLGAVIAGVGPAAAIYFGAVETARTFASRFPPSPLADAAVGVAAQLVAGVAFTPVDVIKERLQAARLTRSPVQSPLAAARAALAAAGPAGLLKGYWMTNAVWLPWGGLYFAGYEALTRRARERGATGGLLPLPAATQLLVGAAAAAAASLATHPLDVVKTRVQVLSAAAPGVTARSALKSALAAEGPSALWAGAGPRAVALAGATGVQWLVYERARAWLRGEGGA